ncbi:MAG: hypothetical protein EZS28_055711 [Streblomastix strix]|uniref:Uncharacterized protein n=1 Tax=Streblomastix strix TaxID=222440 RepID=A0A5J4PYR0_9EUKA|nr:MAG: hypothetical protein EZS28_055711 [Streblomastix strix]
MYLKICKDLGIGEDEELFLQLYKSVKSKQLTDSSQQLTFEELKYDREQNIARVQKDKQLKTQIEEIKMRNQPQKKQDKKGSDNVDGDEDEDEFDDYSYSDEQDLRNLHIAQLKSLIIFTFMQLKGLEGMRQHLEF